MGGTPPGVRMLLIASVVVFCLQEFAGRTVVGEILKIFELYPVFVVKRFFVWEVVTYLFLHGGVSHILFNMLALWMFGRELEEMWGMRNFLRFYFFTGIGAGIETRRRKEGVYPPKEIHTPSMEDSQRAFEEYVTDAKRRLDHDQKFPNEPKQIKPGEDVIAEKKPGFLDASMITGKVAYCKRNEDSPLLWDIMVKPVCDLERLTKVAVIIMNPQEK